jgi:hypothetical protein
MVGDKGDAVGIEDLLRPRGPVFLDGDRRGDVVGQHEVEPGVDQLARFHFFFAAMSGQYLFSNGHHRFSTIQYPLFRFNQKHTVFQPRIKAKKPAAGILFRFHPRNAEAKRI